MGAKTKTVGGSPQGLALSNDFMTMMGALLNGGSTGQPAGSKAYTATTGVAGVLSDILSGGGGKVGGSLATLLQKSQERNIGNLRARFGASGGMSHGTPAAFAEALYRSEAAPQIATQVGKLQLEALSPLLNIYAGITDKSIPDAQIVQEKSGLAQAFGTLGSLAGPAASFFAPGLNLANNYTQQRGNRTQSQ